LRTKATFLAFLISGNCALAQTQGTVTFANSTSTLIQTNGVGLGGSIGVTATNGGGFYYAVFTAETAVTSVTLSDLLNTNWTFTGLYASNRISQPGGRLNGGVNVTVPTGWPPWVSKSFVVAGWSGNIAGKDWATVRAQLTGVEFTNGVWFGSNWLAGSYDGFVGLSAVGNGQSIWSDLPSPNIFGLAGFNNWTPVTGFELHAVAGPMPPRITQQPTSQTVAAGSNVVFTVAIYGWQPGYQWQRDGVDLPDATNSLLNVFAKPVDAGNYTVVVTNTYGSVMSSNAELVVLLPPILTAMGTGGGKVTLDPPLEEYASNSVVTVAASPASGWKFLEWLGDLSGTNPIQNVWMNHDKAVHAIFGTTLHAATTGGGSVKIDPVSEYYAYGSTVQLVARPDPVYGFSTWSGSAMGNTNPLYLTITNASPAVIASFGQLQPLQSSLTVIPVGFGQVSASPSLNVGNWGQSTILTALADSGQSFLGWSGGAAGSSNSISVYFDNQTVIANFTAQPVLHTSPSQAAVTAPGFRVFLTGRYPAVYEMFGGTNLADWYSLGMTTNQFGTCQFDDNTITNLGLQMYRATVR